MGGVHVRTWGKSSEAAMRCHLFGEIRATTRQQQSGIYLLFRYHLQKVTASVPNDAIKVAKKRNRAHRGFTLGQNQVFCPGKHWFPACMWRLVTTSLFLGL